jgi:hypothetical protein
MTTTPEINGPTNTVAAAADDTSVAAATVVAVPPGQGTPPASTSCPSCANKAATAAGARPATPIFSLGQMELTYPHEWVEQEFKHRASLLDTKNLSEYQVMHKLITDENNLDLVEELCVVWKTQGLQTYILEFRHIEALVELHPAAPDPGLVGVCIGELGPMAPADKCNGLVLPIVKVSSFYYFDLPTFAKSIPLSKSTTPAQAKDFAEHASELFQRILLTADNHGAKPEQRTMNWAAVRCSGLYQLAYECHQRDMSLTGLYTRPWQLNNKITELIMHFESRTGQRAEKYSIHVDASAKIPYPVSAIQPYTDH